VAAEAQTRPGPRGSASPIEFRLDAASGVPTYLQLVQQVEHALRLGYLKPLAYLREPGAAALLGSARTRHTETTEVTA
jgi:hypothetical protein